MISRQSAQHIGYLLLVPGHSEANEDEDNDRVSHVRRVRSVGPIRPERDEATMDVEVPHHHRQLLRLFHSMAQRARTDGILHMVPLPCVIPLASTTSPHDCTFFTLDSFTQKQSVLLFVPLFLQNGMF